MESKFLFIFIFVALVLVLGINAVSASSQEYNITIFSFSNNTINDTYDDNSSTIVIKWGIVNNGTTFVGKNISLQVDSAYSVICDGNGTLAYNHISGLGTPNATACLTPTSLVAGKNYTINLNLSEGVHKIIINVSANDTDLVTTNRDAGGNDTLVILNYEGLAFATGVFADWTNTTSTGYSANTTFNTGLFTNITYALYNFSAGQVVYNRSIGIPGVAYANYSGANFTIGGLPDNWYTINITVEGGNATLRGYNKTITRYFIVDTYAPNSTITCTGFVNEAKSTVEKSTTGFSCSCSSIDSNQTFSTGFSTSFDPTTPDVSTTGLKGITCTTADKAQNNGTSSSLTYTVIDLADSGGGSGSDGGGGGGTTVVVTQEQFNQGTTSKLSANDKFELTFTPSSKTTAEIHTVTVQEVGTDSVTVVIASDPVTIKVNVGEEKKVDVDEDGMYDLLVKLNSIDNGKADLVVQATSGEVPVGEGPVSGGTGLPEPGEEPSGGISLWVWIIAVIVIIIIAVIVIAQKNKK